MMVYGVALMCVLTLAAGQILFKLGATALAHSGTFFSPKVLVAVSAAMILYAAASVAWVWVLQKIELGRVYPLMAMAFVLVPIGSYFVFGERFNYQYYFGVVMIVAGIAITVKS